MLAVTVLTKHAGVGRAPGPRRARTPRSANPANDVGERGAGEPRVAATATTTSFVSAPIFRASHSANASAMRNAASSFKVTGSPSTPSSATPRTSEPFWSFLSVSGAVVVTNVSLALIARISLPRPGRARENAPTRLTAVGFAVARPLERRLVFVAPETRAAVARARMQAGTREKAAEASRRA